MRKTLTDRGVAALKPRPTRYALPDPQLVGHMIRVQPSGSKSYVAVARNRVGRQIWTSLGACDVMKIDEARELARGIIKRVRAGLPAVEIPPDSVTAVMARWIKRHVKAKQLRTRWEIVALIKNHVRPAWGDREFTSIKKSDVTRLLDCVEDRSGARSADRVLTIVSSAMHWHASRIDDYVPPLSRGMRRQSTTEQARDRILNDEELYAVWKAAEVSGTFGSIVRLALLTAQRSRKVSSMRWSDIDANGVWVVPQEVREKDAGGALQLPKMALEIIEAQPRGSSLYVFANRDTGAAFNDYSKAKKAFDARLPDMAHWQVHDLRRTARSLMSRAAVLPDVAERTLGHALPGIRGVYDHYGFVDEKRDALARLAALIDSIVHPRPANIVPMTKRKQRR